MGPRSVAEPPAAIVSVSADRSRPQSSRQSGMLSTASADAPSTVTPEIEAAGPALAVARTIGCAASTPGRRS